MDDLLGRENVNFSLVEPEEQDERAMKFKEQRMTRGFDDSETWNLDLTFAKFLVPRLQVFRDCSNGFPSRLHSMDEWREILNKMITGFELWTRHNEWEFEKDANILNDYHHKIDVALDLFKEYFTDLWW